MNIVDFYSEILNGEPLENLDIDIETRERLQKFIEIEGDVLFAEISRKTGIPPATVRKLIRVREAHEERGL